MVAKTQAEDSPDERCDNAGCHCEDCLNVVGHEIVRARVCATLAHEANGTTCTIASASLVIGVGRPRQLEGKALEIDDGASTLRW